MTSVIAGLPNSNPSSTAASEKNDVIVAALVDNHHYAVEKITRASAHSSDLESCIPEEQEDDTSSENNEPTTPIDPTPLDGTHSRSRSFKSLLKPLPPVDTSFTNTSLPADQRQTSPVTPKKRLSLFQRSSSHQVMPSTKVQLEPQNGTSETNLTRRIMGSRQRSGTNSASESPFTTRSNTPPSAQSSARNSLALPTFKVPEPGDNKKDRSSTGFGHFRQRMIAFSHHEKGGSLAGGDVRKRATSVDLKQSMMGTPDLEIAPEHTLLGHRQPWALPAQYGTGSKARRLSLSLPDDFNVDVIDLHEEYSDQSKIIGKRGKVVGKGATSKVSLMVRKGGSSHELYAVKEFRGKSKLEDEEDYGNKIKSEFSISKSLHHPNIVETYRLCTDHGRWNHVMEYCEQGDLFSLVKQGHLQSPERQSDRLCLFKQLIQGVNYLHNNGIAHRDIKLENLLITSQSKLKITDFGVSEVFSGIHPGLRSAGGQCGREMKQEIRLCSPGICGSEPYIAPEVLEKAGEYDPRPLDVWSSAIVMLHLIFGGALWNRAKVNDGQVNYDKIVRGWEKFNASGTPLSESSYPYVDAFDKMIKPPALRRMLLGMLNPDATKRLKVGEVAKKGWMKGVECCQVDSYDEPGVVIDAGKGSGYGTPTKVVKHNHLAPQFSTRHSLFVRSPGTSFMD